MWFLYSLLIIGSMLAGVGFIIFGEWLGERINRNPNPWVRKDSKR